jgi:glycosyltransferase involved in cell wall biosynthesis
MTGSASRPLVSIVIPCYNQAGYLRDAIRSATSREFPVEIVVVDDGSTDGTSAVAAAFAHVRTVRQANRGLSAARNRGLAESTGAFVIFLDADDRLLPGAIDTAARALIAHPACAMAYGRCVMMGPDGDVWPTPEPPSVRSGHHVALLRTNLIWMPAMAIFRREPLVHAGGFTTGVDGSADYDLYLRISREHPIHDHGRLVAAYRRHTASMSGNAGRMLRDTLAVMGRNRPHGDPAKLEAWREGYRNWQDFYGTKLVEEIRLHLRGGESAPAVRKSLWLARLAPAVFARELARKTRVTLHLVPARSR